MTKGVTGILLSMSMVHYGEDYPTEQISLSNVHSSSAWSEINLLYNAISELHFLLIGLLHFEANYILMSNSIVVRRFISDLFFLSFFSAIRCTHLDFNTCVITSPIFVCSPSLFRTSALIVVCRFVPPVLELFLSCARLKCSLSVLASHHQRRFLQNAEATK